MKKMIIVLVLLSIGGLLGAQYGTEKNRKIEEDYQQNISEVSKERDKYKLALDSMDQEEENNSTNENVNKERENNLSDFTDKLLNFDSIDDRNKAIRDYLTTNCIKEQGIDVEINADFDSTGTINGIYQDTADLEHYIILGKDNSRGAEHDVLIDVVFENNKIGNFKIQYMEMR
ncbi:TPA: EF0163 family protein [Enterococcus hirae]|nr:EF0163 family protein [Enterococcus hirae]EOH66621.1 hypothetical protein UAE_02766 [Enterococcus hirae ATCC 9790]EOU03340.1 hypothetical protein I584_02713 [Enterococcus hirae ATCC 9790]OJG49217.1 hypothetical protein RV05_GL001347 [Enterococcus hirae]QQY20822.1 hypothetical protein I6I80_00300 [Enterococcus hirae]VTQ74292.1 lipoprotein [Enterococcus hirae]